MYVGYVSACGTPPFLANGIFTSQAIYLPGSEVLYQCIANHTLIGQNAKTCLESGMWSYNSNAQCLRGIYN